MRPEYPMCMFQVVSTYLDESLEVPADESKVQGRYLGSVV